MLLKLIILSSCCLDRSIELSAITYNFDVFICQSTFLDWNIICTLGLQETMHGVKYPLLWSPFTI